MTFSRWHALGNTYVVTPPLRDPTPAVVRGLVDGADGLVEVAPRGTDEADVVIWNADGSRAEMSGNATRIAAAWLAERTGADVVRIRAEGGEVVVRLGPGGRSEQEFGPVLVGPTEEVDGIAFTPVDVGNPHAVVRGDPEEIGRIGPLLETHARFPGRTNVQVARLDGPGRVTARVWERGVGETASSGTSAIAVAAACVGEGTTVVRFPGGELTVRIVGDRAFLTGTAERLGVKVAALYDIHGNLPALEAVLAEPDVRAAGRIIVGGDLVTGPFPRETLELLLELGFHAALIRGNCERELVGPRHDGLWGRRTQWVAEQLSQEQIERLLALPESLSVDVDGRGPVLFCHASPRSDDEIITSRTPPALLREVAAQAHEPTIVIGHTHVQFVVDAGGTRYVNAGSVGMAYEGVAGAHWALLGDAIELRRTAYDVYEAGERIRATGFPEPDEFVETLVHPPSADEATDHFERAATERGER